MADRFFKPGEEKEAAAALGEQDTRVLFDGRTVVIECLFHTIVDANLLASRLRDACAGPKLRLNLGTVTRRSTDYALVTKSFVNTDEELDEVITRVKTIVPEPDRIMVGLVNKRDAEKIWAELHRVQDGGD